MRVSRSWTVFVVLAVELGCGPSPARPPTPSPPDTRVHLLLTDAPIDDAEVSRVLVTFTSIEVYSEAAGAWTTVLDYRSEPRTFDLLTLQGGVTEELGAFNLEPGTYDQVRLHLSADNAIEVSGAGGPELLPLQVPSGTQTGIKLVHPFTVTGKGPTELTVDFDAAKSVKRVGHGWQLQPEMRVIATSTAEVATRVVGTSGGTVRLIDEGEVEIPAGALAGELEVTISAVVLPEERTAREGLYGGTALELGPHGTTFAVPVTVTLYDNASELAGVSDTALAFLAEERGAWTEVPYTRDPVLGTISAQVSHFSQFAGGKSAQQIVPSSGGAALDPGQEARFDLALLDAWGGQLQRRTVEGHSADPALVSLVTGRCAPKGEAACTADDACLWARETCFDNTQVARVVGGRYPGTTVHFGRQAPSAAGIGRSLVQPPALSAQVGVATRGLKLCFVDAYVDNNSEPWWDDTGEFDMTLEVDYQAVVHSYNEADTGSTYSMAGVCSAPLSLGAFQPFLLTLNGREVDGGFNGADDPFWFEVTERAFTLSGGQWASAPYDDAPRLFVRYQAFWSF